MVQEPRHVLNTLSRVTAELGGGVSQDVDAGRREPRLSEVPLELRVESTAGDAPQRLGGAHHLQIHVPSPQRGPECLPGGLWQFPATRLAALAPVGVEAVSYTHL